MLVDQKVMKCVTVGISLLERNSNFNLSTLVWETRIWDALDRGLIKARNSICGHGAIDSLALVLQLVHIAI